MSSSAEEDLVGLSRESPEKILLRQQRERADFNKRVERIKSSIPRKDRVGRARAAADAADGEKRLRAAQAAERLENGINEEQLLSKDVSPADGATSDASHGIRGTGKTESKAARRRRKKAVQEAELQCRIDTEKANMGPSPKFLESQAIDAQLKPKNLRIHLVPADGHCLYNAIAHQMDLSKFQSAIPSSVDGLRHAAADHIMANKNEYMPFLETVHGDDELFRGYCDDLRNKAVWGGQVELKALSQVLGVEIHVYAADLPIVEMGDAEKSKHIFRVSFHRQYYGLGEHYNSVVPQA